MSLITKEMKAKAEVYHGDPTCREKFMLLLADIGLPVGLLTLDQGIEECGYVKEAGFSVAKTQREERAQVRERRRSVRHRSHGVFRENKIKNLTEVKAKEFLIWISLCEICVNSPNGWHYVQDSCWFVQVFPISVFKNDHHGDWNKEVKKPKQATEICAVKV